jgi:hypothetical protein
MTPEEYDSFILDITPILDAWQLARTQLGIEQVVSSASIFGQGLMVSFAAENVLLGITQEGKTGEIIDKLTGIMAALELYRKLIMMLNI